MSKKILITACIILVISNITTLVIKEKRKGATFQNKYPLLDPAREFTPQDNYLVNIQPLRDYFNELQKKEGNNITIYYEQLNSGSNISVNKDIRMFPASLSKLALALIVANKVEDGKWSWDKELSHTEADLSSESGEFYRTIGTGSTSVDKLLEELLVNSDNTAQNILLRNVVIPDDYIALQQATGLEDLYDSRGYISSKEYTRMLRILYTASFLNRENSEKILDFMSRATFYDYLSQGIPSGVVFAHKYGENKKESIFADSGIVYNNGKPYMISVILKGKDSSPETRKWAVSLMKEISENAFSLVK